jgi:broad-specificity NMP kinase
MVELAGPAGVGKSTLSRVLIERCPTAPGTIWGQPVVPLLGNGVRLVPTFAGLWRHSRSLLWDETRHMVRLSTLHRELLRTNPRSHTLLFDEGPVFALAWLRGFGHPSLRSEVSETWWRTTLEQWATTVDLVVVLDAPDELLAHRIRSRPMWHEIKAASDRDIAIWMQRFRAALDWVLVGLTDRGGPAVIRMAFDRETPDQIADRVLSELSRVCRGN